MTVWRFVRLTGVAVLFMGLFFAGVQWGFPALGIQDAGKPEVVVLGVVLVLALGFVNGLIEGREDERD